MRTETGREEGHFAHSTKVGEGRMHVPRVEKCVPQGIRLYLESNVTAGVIDRRTNQPLGGSQRGQVKTRRRSIAVKWEKKSNALLRAKVAQGPLAEEYAQGNGLNWLEHNDLAVRCEGGCEVKARQKSLRASRRDEVETSGGVQYAEICRLRSALSFPPVCWSVLLTSVCS